jgi:(p)ppGpp synthase/HD superfamily hydrolase
MMKVRDKQISPTKLIRDIYEEQLLAADIAAPGLSNQHNKPPTKSSQPEVVVTKSPVIVDHDKLINYELCQECTPRPGDKIIAKSDRHGIKIHVI